MTERDIFIAALQKEDPAQRQAYLDEACSLRPELRKQVENLLRLYEGAGSFLQKPAMASAATGPFHEVPEPMSAPEAPGTVIGPYNLIEAIGEGGMGTVWMAQQREPVKRLVALKLIKAGMDSKQVIARFEAERQALALMDHPNIARVLDGGTAAGRPYFVMDLVKGVPITVYCDQHHLTPRQRLELFIPVCQAVQHAHQKGIIHRDLKPSNVLVAPYDGKPVVKVIDFGVAKAAGQQLTDHTLVTGFGAVVGTLEYMSPEQAELNNSDIDTRSDIYSLGVLLYELLTGSPPFTRKELEEAGMLEMLRVIREQEPTKPSTKLSTAEGLPTLAANRGTEPAKLTKLVRDELDWIVMKALEKDRNRRYETADGIAMDLQRYLADELVSAGPPSTWYRLRKLVRRHSALLTTVGLVAFSLSIGTGISIWQAVRATNAGAIAAKQRDRALKAEAEANARREAEARAHRRTRDTLSTITDEVSLEVLGKSTQLTAQQKQFLHKVRRLYEEFAASQDDVPQGRLDRAVGYYRVARCQEILGEHRQAEASYREALGIVRPLAADFPEVADYRVVLGSCYDSLARFLRDINRFDEAEDYFKQALAVRQRLVSDDPHDRDNQDRLAGSHLHLGGLFEDTRRPEQAISEYRMALVIKQQLAQEFPNVPDHRRGVAAVHGNLSIAFRAMRHLQEAADASRESVSTFEKLAADFPEVLQYRVDLANAHHTHGAMLDEMGRYPESERAVKRAIALWQELAASYPALPAHRQHLAGSLNNLGIIYRKTNRIEAAEATLRDALVLRQKLAKDFPIVPEYQRELGDALVHLAGVKNVTSHYAEARQLLKQAQASIDEALKVYANDPYSRHALRNLHGEMCYALLGLGQHAATVEEAEAFARLAVDPVGDLYDAACFVARSVPLAEKDANLDESKRQELATRYAVRAAALLQQAVQRGYADAEHMRKDSDLDSLRSRSDFQGLLRQLDEKASKHRESKTGR